MASSRPATSTDATAAYKEEDQQQRLADSIYEDDDDEEWRALFQQQGRDTTLPSAYPAASRRITSSRTLSYYQDLDDTRGFRQSLPLPAFLTLNNANARSPTEEEVLLYGDDYDDEDQAKVLPCGVAVSSKQKASFSTRSSSLKSDQQKQRQSKLNFRKRTQLPLSQSISTPSSSTATAIAGSASKAKGRPLLVWENMVCGAISRSVAQTIMHPANTMKTMLQQSNAPPLTSFLTPDKLPVLFRGAGANFILSVPHGAINFAVLEKVRKEMSRAVQASDYWREREERIGPALDFLSSAISTICCSVVSTPQMMITDNIMAGNYNNLPDAIRGLASQGNGLQGFYARGWWPGLVGKIPSYVSVHHILYCAVDSWTLLCL